MVNYKCPRCEFNTNIKTKYIQHLKRKFICEPIISENSLREEYIKYDLSNKIITLGESSVNSGESSVNLGESSVNLGESLEILKNTKNELICKYCKKTFLRKDYLENHLKKSCTFAPARCFFSRLCGVLFSLVF